MALHIIDVIKYEGGNDTFVWKHGCEDFNNGSQLIEHETQEAVLFTNGAIAATFGPGRYTLDSENYIFIKDLKKTLVTGGEYAFHCEVYFINKTVQMALKWGTDSKVRFLEPELGLPLDIGACGELNLAVSDGKKLVTKLVGTSGGVAWAEGGEAFAKSLQSAFRPMISTMVKSHLAQSIRKERLIILEVDEHLLALSADVGAYVSAGFEEYGLTVPEFYITTIVLPEDDPNFRHLRELQTVQVQTRLARAQSEVRAAQAQSEAEITAARRQIEIEKQTTATETERMAAERALMRERLEGERRRVAAQAEADALRLTGAAEAEVAAMQGKAEAEVMRAQGYDQKDVLQAEVQKAYAEGIGHMGGGSGGSGVVGDMLGLGVGMAAMGTVAPQLADAVRGLAGGAAGQPVRCPACGKELPAGAKFCLECGARVAPAAREVVCPACGKRTPPGKFCTECGAQL